MLTKSKDFLQEYCATVVKIGTIVPIEGTDFLGTTLVNGFPIIVRKDLIHEGDIMIYCPIETQLNETYLSSNDLYEWTHRHLNSNYIEVEDCINQDGLEVAKKMVGFFNKYGRVRILRLRGQASMGYLAPINSLAVWGYRPDKYNWEDFVGVDFDTVEDEKFIQVYIPPKKPQAERLTKEQRRSKRIEKIDRMIPGEFSFHYDKIRVA